jgi:hypothetical protein
MNGTANRRMQAADLHEKKKLQSLCHTWIQIEMKKSPQGASKLRFFSRLTPPSPGSLQNAQLNSSLYS